ncbi:transcriptional regulator family: Fungal Specific TF [Penicillium taxi]|uniref:transcriptional regulator family: Fungal Specific TF n=1 Tax=Penicillium taxi TaxID=168475 RepID=UPI0025450D71|nr:transcriptional regulator family: Fungal Specific TF [Penicillium taxi]KAJ5887534.1 transcriptional regulator family: Fungal Specific TF [Penicillium taxi]
MSFDQSYAASRAVKRSACDLCRLRKIRCDRAQPVCETCFLAGLPCTFTPQPARRRKGIRQELNDAKAKVQQLQAALSTGSQNTPGTSPNDCASPPQTPGAPLSQATNWIPDPYSLDFGVSSLKWHLSYCGLGSTLSATRARFYSVIKEQVGEEFDLDDFLQSVSKSIDPQSIKPARPAIPIKWPPTSLVSQCIEYYETASLYSMFPFADTDAMQMLLKADVLNNPDTSRASHRACLAALTANITIMHRLDPRFADAEPLAYIQAALTLVPDMLMETPDLRTLEAFIMLAFFLAPLGKPQSAEFLLAIAVQVLNGLAGNKNPSVNDAGSRHLRVLFWLCFGMDNAFSFRKCQPPLINVDNCDMELPPAYATKPSAQHFFWKPLTPNELLYPSDLRLNVIQSKIYRLLYSPQSRNLSEARRLQHIRELDDELSALKLDYPVQCRPDLFATETASDYLFHDLSIRGVTVHLEYYASICKIHGSSDSFASDPVPSSWSPPPSSAEICYEATRSTLIYIIRVRHYINYHTFWLHAQFVLTAVITLFRFLVIVPTAPTFARDIDILESILDMFVEFGQDKRAERAFYPPFYLTEALIRKLVIFARKAHVRATAGVQG